MDEDVLSECKSKNRKIIKQWEKNEEKQYKLLKEALESNQTLEIRISSLEKENAELKAKLIQIQSQKSVKHPSLPNVPTGAPLIMALIDGDGNVFKEDLVSGGREGGRTAAARLTRGIISYESETFSTTKNNGTQVWLTVFCNLSGLADIFAYHKSISNDTFKEFILGFSQAAPLFSIVDAGSGKEAADNKVKEYLRVFARYSQVTRVYFGGAHDNGYTSALTSVETEGLLHKIVLLQGYDEIAFEIRDLNIRQHQIPGVFMKHKLPARSYKTSPVNLTLASTSSNVRQESRVPQYLERYTPISKNTPPPCNFHYLDPQGCQKGASCKYGHDYILTKSQLKKLRSAAKSTPCPYVNRGDKCPNGNACISGHFCARGPDCHFYKKDECRFKGEFMHYSSTERVSSAMLESYDSYYSDDSLSC